MKVLRLTRHEAEPKQVADLKRLFGENVEIVMVSEKVLDVERVKELVVEHGADIIEIVLPLPIVAELTRPDTEFKIPILRAITKREFVGDQVSFPFQHYERIIRVEVVSERL